MTTGGNPRSVYIAAAGVVSPHGVGRVALAGGLAETRIALTRRHFAGLGETCVGGCDSIGSIPGEDRAITLLAPCMEELRVGWSRLAEHIPPRQRGVCAATSKGALLLYIEDPSHAHDHFLDLLPDAPARHLARSLNATGPIQALVGACATGLHNILRAAEWIADGRAEIAVAGSTEATLTPMYLSSFAKLGALSRTGCHPFDHRQCGFLAGEGAGLVVLASEPALHRANLQPIARISSWANLAEAFHQTGTKSDGRHVLRLLEMTLARARRAPEEVDLLHAHGTGTRQNDRAEAAALRQLYQKGRMPAVFSAKGAIGHLMGAAGSVEFIQCLECLTRGMLPGTAGFERAAAGCGEINVLTDTQSAPVRRVLKWNLGFGGQMAACLIERV